MRKTNHGHRRTDKYDKQKSAAKKGIKTVKTFKGVCDSN
jgi:hypothetical protein